MVDVPRILIAEDQASLRLLLTATLRRSGWRVTEVSEGQAALRAVAAEQPALLLLDVGLPLLNGYDVCRRLKADPSTSGLKIVLVTARCQPQDKATGLAAGADDYLVKPFSPAQLLAAVRAWLGSGAAGASAGSGGESAP